MSIQSSSSTIKLNLPSGIFRNAKQEADRIGISLQDFIRMLMGSYFANSYGVNSASKNSTLLSEAKKEIAESEYTVINNTQDLDKYLKTLEN